MDEKDTYRDVKCKPAKFKTHFYSLKLVWSRGAAFVKELVRSYIGGGRGFWSLAKSMNHSGGSLADGIIPGK